jgi:hypothetical protein
VETVHITAVMLWPRGLKQQGYVLVQQAELQEDLEDVVSPLTDMSDIRQLVSEMSQHCVVLP